jgi:hypothetical protein
MVADHQGVRHFAVSGINRKELVEGRLKSRPFAVISLKKALFVPILPRHYMLNSRIE